MDSELVWTEINKHCIVYSELVFSGLLTLCCEFRTGMYQLLNILIMFSRGDVRGTRLPPCRRPIGQLRRIRGRSQRPGRGRGRRPHGGQRSEASGGCRGGRRRWGPPPDTTTTS